MHPQVFPRHVRRLRQPIVDFARAHEVWAAPIVFALAFMESLAFISLLVPAWGALVLIGRSSARGAQFLADLGRGLDRRGARRLAVLLDRRKLEHTVQHIWPLSRHPDLIPKGEAFIKKWGALGIFIGRFFGPLRAAVPLVAGIFEMPFWRFQIANFVSAFVWAGVLLTLGDVVPKACG
jgi:membrane protein DedA with SNARE-associated domain